MEHTKRLQTLAGAWEYTYMHEESERHAWGIGGNCTQTSFWAWQVHMGNKDTVSDLDTVGCLDKALTLNCRLFLSSGLA